MEEYFIERFRSGNSFKVDYVRNFLEIDECDCLFQKLEKILKEKGSDFRRKNRTFGDEGVQYKIKFKDNEVTRVAEPWPECIFKIKEKLEKFVAKEYNYNIKFNVCVLQRYPSGKIGIEPHRDKEMTHNTNICGVSIGQPRLLEMGLYRKPPILSKTLDNGSLYVILPPTNDYFSHSIKKDCSENVRLSLTFRNYKM